MPYIGFKVRESDEFASYYYVTSLDCIRRGCFKPKTVHLSKNNMIVKKRFATADFCGTFWDNGQKCPEIVVDDPELEKTRLDAGWVVENL